MDHIYFYFMFHIKKENGTTKKTKKIMKLIIDFKEMLLYRYKNKRIYLLIV